MQAAFEKGEYLKDPANRGAPPPNPLTDPSGVDNMMNMMKSNMVTFIPQTVIMAWINFFFSGFVLCMPPYLKLISEITIPINDTI
jgi:ER membrane protein complex subunit 3